MGNIFPVDGGDRDQTKGPPWAAKALARHLSSTQTATTPNRLTASTRTKEVNPVQETETPEKSSPKARSHLPKATGSKRESANIPVMLGIRQTSSGGTSNRATLTDNVIVVSEGHASSGEVSNRAILTDKVIGVLEGQLWKRDIAQLQKTI